MTLLSNAALKALSTQHPQATIAAPIVTFGFGTDVHCSIRANDVAGDFYYQAAVNKMTDAVAIWNRRELDFVLFNGDFVDGADHTQALVDIVNIENVFKTCAAARYYVFGNHCLDALTKTEFLANTGMQAGYYSFDKNSVHFVVLDACYNSDNDTDHYSAGNYTWTVTYVPPAQRTWLAADLAATALPVVVFCHQRLNGSTNYNVTNAAAVRSILEASGKVKAVFHGHEHVNGFASVNGIPYYEMEAMLDGAYPTNAYAVVSIYASGAVRIQGFASQTSY